MPWKSSDNKSDHPWKSDENGPPDLDEVFKKFLGVFKKSSKSERPSKLSSEDQSSDKNPASGLAIFWWAVLGLIVLWLLTGFYMVNPAERAVVQRFGKYQTTKGPGIHWILRFVESKKVVNVDQVKSIKLSAIMLTEKENFVSIAFAVQYRIGDLKNYLFNVQNPESSLKQIIDSAVRQVVGHSQLTEVLTTGRAKIAQEVHEQIDKLIKRYKPGLFVTDVTMQPATAPEAVKEAFDDVIKAREDKVRLENEAESYANKVVPIAQGQAARILQAAQADKQRLILQAKGKVAPYLAILPIYQKAPKVLGERMYLSSMENILNKQPLILTDTGKGNSNVFYLPLSGSQMMPHVVNKSSNASVATTQAVENKTATDVPSLPNNNAANLEYMRWRGAQ